MACEFVQAVGHSKDYNREAFIAIDAAKRAAWDVPLVVWDTVKDMEPGVAQNAAWAAARDAARAAQADIIRRYFPECPEIETSLKLGSGQAAPLRPKDPTHGNHKNQAHGHAHNLGGYQITTNQAMHEPKPPRDS
jgi:hypothetical protein